MQKRLLMTDGTDPRCERRAVRAVCVGPCASPRPKRYLSDQHRLLQHDTDASKQTDMLNGGIQRLWITNRGRLRLTNTQKP